MSENGDPVPAAGRAGEVLRAARERQGLSLADVAQRTRVPLRQLQAIEQADYASLPSHTYATGFAKAYARAVGEDEVAIARAVRAEIDRSGHRPVEYRPDEIADPARVPSRGLAAVALGLALAIAVLAGLWYATDLFRGGGGGAPTVVAVPPAAGPAPVARPAAAAASGPVVLAAGDDEVWMRVYEAGQGPGARGRTLYLGTLAAGGRFTLPADAVRPLINVGRPDQLAVTVGARAIPPLGDGRRAIRDVAIDAPSLLARADGAAAPAASPTPAPARAPAAVAPRPRSPRPSASRPRSGLSETQRANLGAAATGAPAPAAPVPAAAPQP